MDIWINDTIGFLTGYSTEEQEGLIKVSADDSHSVEMQGGLLDFHNYYYDGKKLVRNTNNPFQKMLDDEANKPPEPTPAEMAERIERLEALLSKLV